MSTNADMLGAYADRLMWWNRKVNLVSRDLTRDDLMLHIKHSLMAASTVNDSVLGVWVDTGTGGGLPGIPLAIALPHKHFILNDVVEKKGIVLKDITSALNLPNTSVQIRDIATLLMDTTFGIVTKHAFKIDDLLRRLNKKPWQELLMLKGSDFESELAGLDTSSLLIEAVSLEKTPPSPFFDGKYLIRLCPTQSTAAHGD